MAFDVMRTASARRAVDREMDRRARKSYVAVRDDLRGRGCEAGGYRLAGENQADYPLCGRHLAYGWRLYTAYPDERRVVILGVDRYRGHRDPASALANILPGVASVGRRSRDKPRCCDDRRDPPTMNEELRDFLHAVT